MLWAIGFFSVFFVQQVSLEKAIAATGSGLRAFQQTAVASPQPLEVSAVTVIRRDQGHADLVALVKNPNEVWGAAQVTATWQVPDGTIPAEEIFINPGTTRPVMALNVPLTSATTASVVMSDPIWARASAAPLPTPNFDTSGLALSSRTVTTSDGDTIATVNVRGDIRNQSVYNFFRVVVPIVIKAGDRIIAVDQVTQTTWPTLSSKTINVTWAYPVNGATAVEAIPQVSRFDAANLYR